MIWRTVCDFEGNLDTVILKEEGCIKWWTRKKNYETWKKIAEGKSDGMLAIEYDDGGPTLSDEELGDGA